MEYQLIRSARRKTIALQVRNAEVLVRAPKFVKTTYLDQLIQSKLDWLEKKVAEQKQQLLLNPQFMPQFFGLTQTHQSSIFIDGLPHHIIVEFGQSNVFHNQAEQRLTVVLHPRYKNHDLHSKIIFTKVKSQIASWFKERIEDYVTQKLLVFSQQVSLYPSSFKVRKYKARWGSCNSRGELSFNYLLKMLPNWVIDYVIIHELCHLKHMNHSVGFWQLVAQHCPEYQASKNWLRKHQPYLTWS